MPPPVNSAAVSNDTIYAFFIKATRKPPASIRFSTEIELKSALYY